MSNAMSEQPNDGLPENMADRLRVYLTGKPGAHEEELFNRDGTWLADGEPFRRPRTYHCSHLVINGRRHSVIGPDAQGVNYVGHYSREDAVAAARRFLDRCREALAKMETEEQGVA